MNLVTNRTLHPHLRDEEALVVENAIRLAIDSIINVLYGVNSARTYEYQRMVADRDKEIQRLECRLREIGCELQMLRRGGDSYSGLLDTEHSLGGSLTSGDPMAEPQTQGGRRGVEQSCNDAEMTAGRQQCEMSISLGLFERLPSHLSSQSQQSAPPSSPSRVGLDQTCTPHSSQSSSVSGAAGNLPTSPSSLVIKEEPCDMDTVLIKWEMSEERFGEHEESTGRPCQDRESPTVQKKLEDQERRNFLENPHSDPGRHCVTEGEHLRNKKKTVPMCALSEEAQRMKRAAWRAASRRYYARKVARQQAKPSHCGPFPHITDSQFSQPISSVDNRRRTLISQLPEESM